MAFHHRGHRLCGTTFRMLHGICIEYLVTKVLTQANDYLIAQVGSTSRTCYWACLCVRVQLTARVGGPQID